MSKSQKLIKDTLIYALASFGPKLVSFILLPFYTHYFTSAEYGTWDIILTTTSLLAPFISLEIISSVYRWLVETINFVDRKKIISTGFIGMIRNVFIFNALASILFIIFPNPYEWLALIIINLDCICDFLQQCVRGIGHNKQFALVGVLKTSIMMALTVFFTFGLHLRIETFFYAMIVSDLFSILYCWKLLKFHRYISKRFYSKDTFKEFIKYSMPLILGSANWWIMNVSDRYIIALNLGTSANGIYAVANKMPSLVTMLSSIFFLAWQDNAIRGYNLQDRDKYYSEIFKHYSRLMFTTVILLIVSNRIILRFMVSSEFGDAWKYVGMLYLGAMFSSFAAFWGAGYQGAKQTNIIFVTTGIGAIVNVIINLLLIKSFGIYTASLSTMLCFFIMWIVRVLDSKKQFNISIVYKDMIILLISALSALSLSYFSNIIIDSLLFLAGSIMFIFYNATILKRIVTYSKNIKFGKRKLTPQKDSFMKEEKYEF